VINEAVEAYRRPRADYRYLTVIVLGLEAGVASAAPAPPPNPGGHYGAAYEDLISDLNLTQNDNSYDENGNFILYNMFGTVCNNPGSICM
jgi:hypothetical protein